MNFIPLGKRVLIERQEETKTTASGIIIPDSASEKPFTGTVVAVSAEVDEVKVGDTVVFGKYNYSELTVDGKNYLVLETEHLLGIMK